MDMGTLRFARNGRDLGMAVQGLEGTLYPAFSMYNRYESRQLFRLKGEYGGISGEKDGRLILCAVNIQTVDKAPCKSKSAGTHLK